MNRPLTTADGLCVLGGLAAIGALWVVNPALILLACGAGACYAGVHLHRSSQSEE